MHSTQVGSIRLEYLGRGRGWYVFIDNDPNYLILSDRQMRNLYTCIMTESAVIRLEESPYECFESR